MYHSINDNPGLKIMTSTDAYKIPVAGNNTTGMIDWAVPGYYQVRRQFYTCTWSVSILTIVIALLHYLYRDYWPPDCPWEIPPNWNSCL